MDVALELTSLEEESEKNEWPSSDSESVPEWAGLGEEFAQSSGKRGDRTKEMHSPIIPPVASLETKLRVRLVPLAPRAHVPKKSPALLQVVNKVELSEADPKLARKVLHHLVTGAE